MKNGLILLKPTTVDKTGASSTATISTLGSVDFTNCETLSLNGVFSSDYDNYRIVIKFFGGVSNSYAGFYRLRNSGTDATASNYTYQTLIANGTSVAGSRTSSTNYGYLFMVGYDAWSGCIGDIYGPYLAQPTASRAINVGSGSGGAVVWDLATTHSLSSSYDGISLIPSGDHFSGRVAVYGMRK
jgi:hypothetical protein